MLKLCLRNRELAAAGSIRTNIGGREDSYAEKLATVYTIHIGNEC